MGIVIITLEQKSACRRDANFPGSDEIKKESVAKPS